MASSQNNTSEKYILFGLILFSIIWASIILGPHLFDPYRVPIDAQNHYWMAKFQNLSLFENDVLSYADDLIETSIFGIPIILYPRSVGYAFVFWAGSFLISPLWLGKFLIFILLPVSVFFTYQIGRGFHDPKFGLFLGALFVFVNLASPDSLSLASGLQRSFAFPLFLLFVYFLQRDRFWALSFVMVLGALFYLPTVPIMGLTFLTYRLTRKNLRKNLTQTWLPFVLAVMVSSAAAVWALSISFDLKLSETIPGQIQSGSIFSDPRYQPGGAAPMYLRFPWIGRAGLFESYPETIILLVAVSLCVILEIGTSKKMLKGIPPLLWHFLIAGVVMYFLSLITLVITSSPVLYMPSRYLRYPLFLISIFLLALGRDLRLQDIKKIYRPGNHGQFLFRMGLILIILAFGTGVIFGFQIPEWPGWFILVTAGIVIIGNLLVAMQLMVRKSWKQLNFSSWISKPGLVIILYSIITVGGVIAYSRLVGYGTINPAPELRDVYRYVNQLPEDALLAGSPEELTGIPLFAQRRVLFRDLRPRRDAPVFENFRAYYTSDWDEVAQFCRQFSVDYIIYNNDDYQSSYLEMGQFFYQPYNGKIKSGINTEPPFAVPNQEEIFSSGSIGLIRCD